MKSLGLGLYSILMLAPIWCLFFLSGSRFDVDASLLSEASWNSGLLAFWVLTGSSVIGYFLSFVFFFYDFPLRGLMGRLVMLQLALPAYVMAFIYLGLSAEGLFFPVQGEFWFLVFVLTLALTPYVFFFSNIGFRSVGRSEWESHLVLGGSFPRFFFFHLFPKTFPFLLSAQVLVLFECLSDFGAASMVNVPVITTMIYKIWYDLFSFEGAVLLSLRYGLVILVILFAEFFFRLREQRGLGYSKDPFLSQPIKKSWGWLITAVFFLFLFLGFVLPVLQLIHWLLFSGSVLNWASVWDSLWKTLLLASLASFLALVFTWLNQWTLYHQNNRQLRFWNMVSSVGYSVPGSLLAVATYALILKVVPVVGYWPLLISLTLALSYKFLTVAMRPLSERFVQLPRELLEVSQIMGVSKYRQWTHFYWPYLSRGSRVVFFLVVIEILKEMPLTLMLAPSGFQTLSIQIFNLTSEGEWEKAALPSLMLIVFGFFAVVFLEKQEETPS